MKMLEYIHATLIVMLVLPVMYAVAGLKDADGEGMLYLKCLLIAVPIYLSERRVEAKVEIQIRTVAMDFWASLEHKINYKFDVNVPDYIQEELFACAKMVSELDEKMLSLNEEVKALELDR